MVCPLPKKDGLMTGVSGEDFFPVATSGVKALGREDISGGFPLKGVPPVQLQTGNTDCANLKDYMRGVSFLPDTGIL